MSTRKIEDLRFCDIVIVMDENQIEMIIQGIAFDPCTQKPVILLQSRTDSSILPLELSPFEANAILVNLKGIRTPRLLTHDLFAFFMRRHSFAVTGLLIYGRDENKYKAKLEYAQGRKVHTLDVRPSDGIALALQFNAPIFAYDYLVLTQPEDLQPYRDPDHLPPESLYIDAEGSEQKLM